MRQNYIALFAAIAIALFMFSGMMLNNHHYIDLGESTLTTYDKFGIFMIFSYLWARVEIGLYKIRKEALKNKELKND